MAMLIASLEKDNFDDVVRIQMTKVQLSLLYSLASVGLGVMSASSAQELVSRCHEAQYFLRQTAVFATDTFEALRLVSRALLSDELFVVGKEELARCMEQLILVAGMSTTNPEPGADD